MADIPPCRRATPADAPAIARLHTRVWRETYRDLAPAEAYAALDEPRRLAMWSELLSDDAGLRSAFVAEDGGILAGFGLCGPPGSPAFGASGEVKYLYVDGAQARRGIGRRLLGLMAGCLAGQGYSGLALGVVAGNEPAIAFYSALGGRPVGRYRDAGPLWRSDNLIYAWDDLAALSAGIQS